ncbi:MAG: GOLPH3/VPS74 family protein [Desulfonatronovibrionaceae bacterium]
MLTFAEEILLLALDDKKGVIKPLPCHSMRFALTGAILMELAFAYRIDTDLETLTVVNTEPTGEEILDQALARLQDSDVPRSTEFWLNDLAWNTPNLKDKVLQRLVDKNVLKLENKKILWFFEARRYPIMDDQNIREVKSRLREIILNREVPSPRDAVLISLIQSCTLFNEIFTPEELEKVMPWISKLASLDLIGREVNQSIKKIFQAMAASGMPS